MSEPAPSRHRSRSVPAVLLLGLLLLAPSLAAGFLLDDHIYLLMMENRVPGRDPGQSLFEFFPDDAGVRQQWLREGMLPWWAGEDVHFSFFRPLSAALMRLDHAAFGRWAPGYHLHSLLWWALLLVAVAGVLRRALPQGVAVLALLLFALDESHVLPVAWVSNRNALVAIAPVVLGLAAHLRWREDGWGPGRWLSLALYAVGLAGGEAALGAMAYPVAYEALGRRGPLRARLVGLVPLAVLGAAYAAIYRLGGHGVTGSALYVDPVREPLVYLRTALTRIPTLLSGSLAGVSSDLWLFRPSARGALVVAGLAGAAVTGFLLRASWPRDDARTRRHLRWLLAGSAGTLLPAAATFPSDRLTLGAELGIAAVVAVILAAGREAWKTGRRRWLAAAAIVPAAIHLVLAPISVVGVELAWVELGRVEVAVARQADVGPPPDRIDAVVLSAPDHVVGIYVPLVLYAPAAAVIRSWRPLSLAPFDHRVTRVDDHTLDVEVVGGSMMTSLFERLYRPADRPLRVGDVLDRGAMQVEVLSANDTGPTRVRFRFARSLDDPSLRLLAWRDGRLRRIPPPEIGGTVTIPHERGPAGL